MAGRRKGGIFVPISTEFNSAGLQKAHAELDKFGKSVRKTTGLDKWAKGIGVSLGLAATAAGAFAVKLGVDSVKAAMEEEQAVAKLDTTLRNLGFASASEQVSKFIDDLQFATGVADDELRPAFGKLLTATKDVAAAQGALRTSLDLATYAGVSAEDAATAIAKAYAGNTKSLKTMVPGMDSVILKSGSMSDKMSELNRIVGGQSAAAAKTLAGQMKILGIAVDEAKESFGQGIIEGLMGGDNKSAEETAKTLRDMQDQFKSIGNTVGTFITGAVTGFTYVKQAVGAMVVQAFDLADGWERAKINMADFLGLLSDEDADAQRRALDASYAARHAAAAQEVFGIEAQGAAEAAASLAGATGDAAGAAAGLEDNAAGAAAATDKLGIAAFKATSRVDQLKSSLDELNGRNRSVIRDRINLRSMRREGADKSGKRKGAGGKMVQFSTPDDLKTFALDYAEGAEQLAQDILAQGGKGAQARAMAAIRGARQYLTPLVGRGFVNSILSMPAPTAGVGQQVAGYRYAAMGSVPGGVVNNYYISGEWNVASAAEAVEQSKKAARLAAISGRYSGMAATGRGYVR